jgi:hypothetical protein
MTKDLQAENEELKATIERLERRIRVLEDPAPPLREGMRVKLAIPGLDPERGTVIRWRAAKPALYMVRLDSGDAWEYERYELKLI